VGGLFVIGLVAGAAIVYVVMASEASTGTITLTSTVISTVTQSTTLVSTQVSVSTQKVVSTSYSTEIHTTTSTVFDISTETSLTTTTYTQPPWPVVDRSGTDTPGLTQSFSETIQISQANALMLVWWSGGASVPGNISTITSVPSAKWQSSGLTCAGGGCPPLGNHLWWATIPNAGPLNFTVTLTNYVGRFFKVFWFDILGANLTQPFDPNPTLLTSGCCPQGDPNVSPSTSTTYPNDLVLALEEEVGGSVPSNNITYNSPFNGIVSNFNGGYSHSLAWAYFRSPSVISGATYSPVAWGISGETLGALLAIKADT